MIIIVFVISNVVMSCTSDIYLEMRFWSHKSLLYLLKLELNIITHDITVLLFKLSLLCIYKYVRYRSGNVYNVEQITIRKNKRLCSSHKMFLH